MVVVSSEHILVKEHITLKITFESEKITKMIEVKYLVVDTLSPYNAILGRPILKLLGMILYTLRLSLKYPLLDGRVDVVTGDKEIS